MSCLARITSSYGPAPHNASCTMKHKNGPLDHFSDHRSNERIQKLTVECTNQGEGCDWTGVLKDLDDHRSQCPKQEIPCTLSEVGCETRFPREVLDDHIAKNQKKHFELAVKSTLRLRQELATTQEELQELQATLSKCMDEVRTLPAIFNMSRYGHFREARETWYSATFYSRLSDCRLRLCIRPLKSSNEELFNVAIELLTNPMPWIPYISLKMEVLNQASNVSHLMISFTSKTISTPTLKRCGEKFEEVWREILLPTYPGGVQYLRSNCLFFRVSENEKAWLVDPTYAMQGLTT